MYPVFILKMFGIFRHFAMLPQNISHMASHSWDISHMVHLSHMRGSEVPKDRSCITVWNEAYIMLVSCIDYALDMTCIQSVSQCFIVGGIL